MGGDNSILTSLHSWTDPWYLAYLGACCACGFCLLVYLNTVESTMLEETERELMADGGSSPMHR